jgi:glycogen(starch) synthase
VVIISHALLEDEHLKNVAALGRMPGTEVLAVVPRSGQVTLFEGVRAVDRADVRALGSWRPRGQIVFWPPTLRVRDFGPDLIHVDYPPWSPAFWQAAMAARLTRPRATLVCTVKKNTYRRYSGPIGWAKTVIGSIGFRVADGVEFSSEMAREIIFHLFPLVRALPTAVLTHQAVDVTHFAPRTADLRANGPFVIGYAGRIDGRYKALSVLIDATQECRRQLDCDIRVVVIGTGPDADDLRRRSKDMAWLRVLAPVPMKDVAPFLQTLDLFVLPSRVRPDHEEHDAHALLQAAACGVPSIATASGINPEIVARGVGLLVAPDDVDALAGAIRAIVTDRRLGREVSERSRRAAEKHFAVDVVARARLAFYAKVIGRRRRPNAI